MKVRAEVEERDAAKIRIGQRVVVPRRRLSDQDFEGRVGSIARSLSQPNIVSRGPRRPNDVVEVLEALVDTRRAAAAADGHARRRVLQARRDGLDEVNVAAIAGFRNGRIPRWAVFSFGELGNPRLPACVMAEPCFAWTGEVRAPNPPPRRALGSASDGALALRIPWSGGIAEFFGQPVTRFTALL